MSVLRSAWRFSAAKSESDGFRHNAFLGRDDTNGRDETTVRLRWQASPRDDLDLDLAALAVDLDNGYDAFAIDNSLTTQSDEPGRDSQRARGASLRVDWRGAGFADLSLLAAWSIPTASTPTTATGAMRRCGRPWSTTSATTRAASGATRSLELRLASRADAAGPAWLVGAYLFGLDEHIRELSGGDYVDAVADFSLAADDRLDSRYSATHLAVLGELDGTLGSRWRWSLGGRVERRDADYSDASTSFGLPVGAQSFSPRNSMWGGRATLSRDLGRSSSLYLGVSRGYKAGGFNIGLAVPDDRRSSGPSRS